jgi:maltose O-acetyltransferase
MIKGAGRKIFKKIAKEIPGAGLRVSLLKLIGIKIGEKTYIAEGLTIAESLENPQPIIIGDRVAIGPEVILITSSHPNNSTLKDIYGIKEGAIIIQNDAWIGAGAIILPGITIGRRAVVGAGAVVTKNIPDDTVYIGATGTGRLIERGHE